MLKPTSSNKKINRDHRESLPKKQAFTHSHVIKSLCIKKEVMWHK